MRARQLKTSLEVIEEINDLLVADGFTVFYKKIDELREYPSIIILEQTRKPIEPDMVDTIYTANIEVNYQTNQTPTDLLSLYSVRDRLLKLFRDNKYPATFVSNNIEDNIVTCMIIIEMSVI